MDGQGQGHVRGAAMGHGRGASPTGQPQAPRPRARRSPSMEGPSWGAPKKSDFSNSYVYQHMYTVLGIDISH